MISRIACTASVCLLVSGSAAAQDVIDRAEALIGRPYVWGAEGPHSFDCSGLTQYVYQEIGIDLPRRAISQSKIGDATGRRLRRGDLLFFSSDARKSLVTHVGLYAGDGLMINASQRHGHVREDSLSDPFWAARFMFARRVERAGVVGSSREVVHPPARGDIGVEERRRPSGDRRRETVRVLERVAGVLLRLPRR